MVSVLQAAPYLEGGQNFLRNIGHKRQNVNIPLGGNKKCFGLPDGRRAIYDFVSMDKEEKER